VELRSLRSRQHHKLHSLFLQVARSPSHPSPSCQGPFHYTPARRLKRGGVLTGCPERFVRDVMKLDTRAFERYRLNSQRPDWKERKLNTIQLEDVRKAAHGRSSRAAKGRPGAKQPYLATNVSICSSVVLRRQELWTLVWFFPDTLIEVRTIVSTYVCHKEHGAGHLFFPVGQNGCVMAMGFPGHAN